jgi:alanyl-tRNA synthetase
MKSDDVRRTFLDFFLERGHTVVPSSSLIPAGDPTLLFTNAGMVQFKGVFVGQEKLAYSRACSVQKCLRVSGKHNDLEQVGDSPCHHTFFEMLGNFSFGDYFKREAIHDAWELLTLRFQLPVERLWITVYTDDDEAARVWAETGVARERILRFGEKENFWSMGDTGPCGPSSEVHYYQGDIEDQRPDGVNSNDHNYIEIWNLVFMQYDRDARGQLTPLSSPSVDTGMGLERISSVLQDVHSNYVTDLFQPILQRMMQLLATDQVHYDAHRSAYHTIADHSRAIAFLIADGVMPGNTGRNYVLRRIIRRAAYAGQTLGFTQPFLAHLTLVTIELLGRQYPELQAHSDVIREMTTREEQRFQRTLQGGLRHLEESIIQLVPQREPILSGAEAFKLYDTYGFPFDLTRKILAERGITVEEEAYEAERVLQQQRSRQAAGQQKKRGPLNLA